MENPDRKETNINIENQKGYLVDKNKRIEV